MIISQTPLRISLGGGGTDLPSYSTKKGGLLLTTAIDKYVYVIVRRNLDEGIRFTGYYNKEIVQNPKQLKHPVLKAILTKIDDFKDIKNNIEIVTLSDLPANSGLGGSSSFIVGLFNALWNLKGKQLSPLTLAKKSWNLERLILKEAGGVQDQYIAAFGGVKSIKISKKGQIKINKINLTKYKKKISNEFYLIKIGYYRSSSNTQKKTINLLKKSKEKMLYLDEIKKIGIKNKNFLKKGNLYSFGLFMKKHWELKKKYGDHVTNSYINKIYSESLKHGSTGGKVIGAGSGGFMLFHVNKENKKKYEKFLKERNLEHVKFNLTNSGSKILVNPIKK